MRIETIERQTTKEEKIKLSLELDVNNKIEEFDELETICGSIKDMYDSAIKAIFINDSEDIVKKLIGMS